MKAIDAVFTRRSIRAYNKEKPLSQSQIDTILAAGCAAPSAHNGRPWEFIVVKNKDTIRALSEVKKYYKRPLADAPCVIAVLINTKASERESLDYMHQDCSAATQNMLIAATAMGLGSCWMGGLLEKEEIETVDKLLKLPEDIRFFGLVSLGYATEEKEKRGAVEKDKVHFETY